MFLYTCSGVQLVETVSYSFHRGVYSHKHNFTPNYHRIPYDVRLLVLEDRFRRQWQHTRETADTSAFSQAVTCRNSCSSTFSIQWTASWHNVCLKKTFLPRWKASDYGPTWIHNWEASIQRAISISAPKCHWIGQHKCRRFRLLIEVFNTRLWHSLFPDAFYRKPTHTDTK